MAAINLECRMFLRGLLEVNLGANIDYFLHFVLIQNEAKNQGGRKKS
jgi:hypothetical protein